MWRLFLIVLLLVSPSPTQAVQGIVQTVHNLSASGPGPVRSLTVTQVCVFCHTPHNASPSVPLWNREMSGATYLQYQSTTLTATTGQPTGRSRLCLSCHDGTVALGALRNVPAGEQLDLASTFVTGRARLGTDLSDDHPVSFVFDRALQARNQRLVPPDSVDLPFENKRIECSTCHDPHEKDVKPFLRKASLNGELCTTCHNAGSDTQSWLSSSHATSAARPSGPTNPWTERKPEWRGQTVAENACFNCHTPHNAVTPQRLVKDKEEKTCYRCHDGTTAATDVRAEMLKPSRHSVELYSGVHDAAEDFGLSPPPPHVECADCHNPHSVDASRAQAPAVPGPLIGVKGIDATGAAVPEVNDEDEVCYKCHGDHSVVTSPVVTRQIFETNTRLEFDVANPSHHAVQGPGRSSNVPSLIGPMTESSRLYCTDCHNSDSAASNGGTGPNGPHGSIYSPLLERNYATADNSAESPIAYALCYKCHDRTSILADESFPEHRRHVVNSNAPCSVCHDPHGVSSIQGNPFNNSHLINFDVDIVLPNSFGMGPVFEKLGDRTGQCSLTCHGKEHQSLRY